MTFSEPDRDARLIEESIRSMLSAVSWSEDAGPDWIRFRKQMLPGPVVVAPARRAGLTSLDWLIEEMEQRRRSGVTHLAETLIAPKISVFGAIAVALASYETVADGRTSRGVNAFLFVKNEGCWRVAALAWDTETASLPIPPSLGGNGDAL